MSIIDGSMTDCFEATFDQYMLILSGQSSTACTTGLGVVSSYDANNTGSGNTPEDGGVNGSNYVDVINYGANLNGFTAHTSLGTDVASYLQQRSGSGSGSGQSAYQFDAMGVYNDPNDPGSHMVNITGMYKDENGVWQVQYKDYQNDDDPPTKHMAASKMLGVTTFDPIDSGSGSGS